MIGREGTALLFCRGREYEKCPCIDPPRLHQPRTERETPALLNALHRSVLALDARFDECRVREDEDARAADEPEKGRDRGRDPEDRDADDQEDHVEVFRFDRGRAELDRFRDEAVDPDVALRGIANLRVSEGTRVLSQLPADHTHADEEGDGDEEKRVREERVNGEEEKHCAQERGCERASFARLEQSRPEIDSRRM